MSIIKALEPARYMLIAKTNRTPIMDRPRPKSEGGLEKRFEAKGARLEAYKIEEIEGVTYALLKTTNAQDEWTRLAEAGPNPFEWWDVIEIEPPQDVAQARAMTRIADACVAAVKLLEIYLNFKMK